MKNSEESCLVEGLLHAPISVQLLEGLSRTARLWNLREFTRARSYRDPFIAIQRRFLLTGSYPLRKYNRISAEACQKFHALLTNCDRDGFLAKSRGTHSSHKSGSRVVPSRLDCPGPSGKKTLHSRAITSGYGAFIARRVKFHDDTRANASASSPSVP